MCSWCMRNLTYAEKLKGFPTVNFIGLKDSHDRYAFMTDQFNKYGIRYHAHLVDRYVDIKDTIKIRTPENYADLLLPIQVGAIVAQIDNIRRWLTTGEEYAIFCEDDISFKSIEYWNFTWEEFMALMPKDWVCCQLIRMEDKLSPDLYDWVDMKIVYGRFWGATWMMKREYALSLISMLYNEDDGSYNLTSCDGAWYPIIENVMMLNYNKLYNFPLLTENNETLEPHTPPETEPDYYATRRRARKLYNHIYNYYWEALGPTLDLTKAMEID